MISHPDFEFVDGWILRETKWNPEKEDTRATVFALANGYMGCRGAFEEANPRTPYVVGNYINGIYDTPLGKLTEREIVNIPDWHHVIVTIDGEPFDMTTGEVLEYRRELDMRQGILRRCVRWKSPGGKVVRIETERFISMGPPNVACIDYRVTPEQKSEIGITASIREDVTNNRCESHTRAFRPVAYKDGISAVVTTHDPGYEIGVAVALDFKPSVKWEKAVFSEQQTSRSIQPVRLGAGKTLRLRLYAGIADSRFGIGGAGRNAREMASRAMKEGYKGEKGLHVSRWREIWDISDVVIEGDDDAQLGIRFSLFHLLASAPWRTDEVSLSARGLQGQDYYGSIFWDCEIFCFPFYLATQPEVARNCLGYRRRTLNGARRKANNYGYKGAFYAWQSQETGDDQCALYVFNDPRTGKPIRAPYSDQQIHISADIAYALKDYVTSTGDWEFVWESGLEVALEIARFFADRAEKDTDGTYHLRGVLGPDEYHEMVDDNGYTNALAKRAIETAMTFMEKAAAEVPERLIHVRTKIDLTDEEIDLWRTVADRLVQQTPNNQRLIEQFAGYFGLEDCPVDVARARLAHPQLPPGGPLGPFQSTQNIKQADVVMMLYLLRHAFSTDVKRANWDYYNARTSHDSSLSKMAYSLVAADVGMTEPAYRNFIDTSHIDLTADGPHWNHGVHTAALGGAWLALMHGFCRFEHDENGLRFRDWPLLPEQWNRVAFRTKWHGQVVEVVIEGRRITMNHLSDGGDVTVFTPEGSTQLIAGDEVQFTW
jgi:kojibiose phosphorylase